LRYSVVVEAPQLGWRLRRGVETHDVTGDIVLAIPMASWKRFARLPPPRPGLLATSPQWVHVPVEDWLNGSLHRRGRSTSG
jgi:hypothetical protein